MALCTRTGRLMVLVGQGKVRCLAVRDWRRVPRHTALDRLLAGTLRFIWPPASVDAEGDPHEADPASGSPSRRPEQSETRATAAR